MKPCSSKRALRSAGDISLSCVRHSARCSGLISIQRLRMVSRCFLGMASNFLRIAATFPGAMLSNLLIRSRSCAFSWGDIFSMRSTVWRKLTSSASFICSRCCSIRVSPPEPGWARPSEALSLTPWAPALVAAINRQASAVMSVGAFMIRCRR